MHFGELGFAAVCFCCVCGFGCFRIVVYGWWRSCGLRRLVCFVSGWCLAVAFDFLGFVTSGLFGVVWRGIGLWFWGGFGVSVRF